MVKTALYFHPVHGYILVKSERYGMDYQIVSVWCSEYEGVVTRKFSLFAWFQMSTLDVWSQLRDFVEYFEEAKEKKRGLIFSNENGNCALMK